MLNNDSYIIHSEILHADFHSNLLIMTLCEATVLYVIWEICLKHAQDNKFFPENDIFLIACPVIKAWWLSLDL